MAFDPKKPFGVISGICTVCPGAKFEQRGVFYDVDKEEIRPGDEAKSIAAAAIPVAPPEPPVSVEQLESKLDKAKTTAKKKPTPANRAAVTKLENQIANLSA